MYQMTFLSPFHVFCLKYLQFLDQLSEKMNVVRVAADIGFDMRLDTILARVEQLIKLEGDTLTENKIIARNLQRKVGGKSRI